MVETGIETVTDGWHARVIIILPRPLRSHTSLSGFLRPSIKLGFAPSKGQVVYKGDSSGAPAQWGDTKDRLAYQGTFDFHALSYCIAFLVVVTGDHQIRRWSDSCH